MTLIDLAEMTGGRRNPEPPLTRLIRTAEPYTGAQWEPPVPLDVVEAPDLAYPVDALFDPLKSYITMLAAVHQAPTAMIATHALAALSGLLCGKLVTAHGNGGIEQAGLYALTFAPSGGRKSRVHNDIMRPIADEEMQRALAAEAERRLIEDDLKDIKAKRAEARRRGAPSEELQALYAKEIELEAKARDPHFVLSDATDEGLQRMLAENGGVALVASPESQILSIAAGRYADTPVYDTLLAGYSGDPIASARRNRTTERIPEPAIALALMAQPAMIRVLASIKDAAPRGLLARFITCIVGRTDHPGERRTARGAPVNTSIQARYRDLVRRLAALSLPERHSGRPVLRLDDQAERLRDEIHEHFEDAILQHEEDAPITPWLEKATGHTVRIAAVLHAVQNADFLERPINIETLDRAYELLEFYRAHAEVLHPRLTGAETEAMANARQVLRWIINGHRFDGFTVRDALRGLRRRIREKRQLMAALAILEEHGYVRVVSVSTGGRPAEAVEVHPDLRQA